MGIYVENIDLKQYLHADGGFYWFQSLRKKSILVFHVVFVCAGGSGTLPKVLICFQICSMLLEQRAGQLFNLAFLLREQDCSSYSSALGPWSCVNTELWTKKAKSKYSSRSLIVSLETIAFIMFRENLIAIKLRHFFAPLKWWISFTIGLC